MRKEGKVEENSGLTGGQKMAYFTFLMLLGVLGLCVSMGLKSSGMIVSGNETLTIPSAIMFMVGMTAVIITSIDA